MREQLFGDYLKELVAQEGITHTAFYQKVGIAKPYFYEIISGKAAPPPPKMQYKILDHLETITEYQRKRFLDLAAAGRGEVSADIAEIIMRHPENLDSVRDALNLLFLEENERDI